MVVQENLNRQRFDPIPMGTQSTEQEDPVVPEIPETGLQIISPISQYSSGYNTSEGNVSSSLYLVSGKRQKPERHTYLFKEERLNGMVYLPFILSAAILVIFLAIGLPGRISSIFLENRSLSDSDNQSYPVNLDRIIVSDTPQTSRDTVQPLVYTKHTVKKGETLSRIAFQYGLLPSTLISINSLESADDLVAGTLLIVPYRDGFVVDGSEQTYNTLARQFGTNGSSFYIIPGTKQYFVTGQDNNSGFQTDTREDVEEVNSSPALASMSQATLFPASEAGGFGYPVNGRVITGYGKAIDVLTKIPYESEGIELAAPLKAPVLATRKGTVILSGTHANYGKYIILSHSGGWRSFYGYLDTIEVETGSQVEKQQQIGSVGQSGVARQSGVYFALFRNGKSVDPLDYLN